MNTKTLLLLGVFGAAGLTSAVAQTNVYSVNAVGYVNKTIPTGFSLIANPLLNTAPGGNTVSNLFASFPDGITVFSFSAGGFSGNAKDFGEWSNPNQTIVPGEGVFIQNLTGAPLTVTFVGDVQQGSLTNSLPAGYSIKSSVVPQAGLLQTALGFPVADGDTIYRYVNNGTGGGSFVGAGYDFGSWSAEPQVAVAESFFVLNGGAAKPWIRSFSVNQ